MTTKVFRSRALIHCLTLFCLTSIVFSYSLVGNVLQDLTSTDGNFFTEAAAWTASHLVSSDTLIAYPCNNTILLGGFDVLGSTVANGSQYGEYFQRIYTGLPSHNAITFKLGFWALDSWEGSNGDTFQIAFDSTILDGWAFTSQDTVTPNTCGVTNAFDVPNVTIEGTVPHTGDSLVFQVISKLNQDSGDESFGFRDIQFTFVNATPAPTTSTICARAPTVLPDSRKCSCANANEFEYPVGSGTCITCDSTCATCSGSASNQCLSCPAGLYKSGTSCLPCDNSCFNCTGAGTQACTSCKPGTYLNGVQCSSCNSNCATCISGTSSSCTSCPAGRYPSGYQCPQCHSSCKTCSGGLINQCVTCPTNSYMINNNTCIPSCSSPLYTTTDGINVFCESPCSSGQYAYWDGTCSSSCDSPLSQSVIGSYQLCTYGCAYNEYLYWNKTCKSTCPFPLQVQEFKTKSLCTYKCSLSQYLFWNGTCADSCPFPLKTRVESGRQYCDYPCTSSQYLRWDQTCVSSCPLPLQIQIVEDARYCNFPCSSSQYAYWDGNCSSTACSSPLTLRTEGSGNYQRKFCDLDCGANEYMHWMSMCVSSCDAPLIVSTYNGNPTCNPPCTTSYPYYFTDLNTCGKNCVSPRLINSTGLYLVCEPAPEADEGGSLLFFLVNAPVTPHEYTVVVTGNTLDYIHYLDMPMPDRFEKLANSSGKSFLSPRFGLSEPQDFTSRRMLTTFVNYPLPEVFERSGLQSSFIINYWDAMTTLAILLAIALGLTIIERILRITQLKALHGIVERLQVMATGNYFLLILISSIQEIILYIALEVRSFSYDFLSTSSSIANFGVTIVMLILVAAAIAVMIFAAKKAYDADAYDFNEKSSQDYLDFAIKWRSIQVLFRGFKSDNIFSRLFYLLYIIRLSIPTLVAACMIDYPLIQAIVQVVVNAAILIYIILKKPFKRKANLVQLVIFEGVTLLLNIFVLIIVVVATNDLDPEFKVVTVLGDIVIVGASILTLLRLVFLVIKGKLEADSILKIRKQYPQKGLAVWVGLLSVLAQQTGFGFEEIFEEKCISDTGNKYMGIFARSVGKEKVNSTRINKIYPDTPNDLEPILLQNNSSLPKLAGSRAETPLGTSMLIANIETKTQPESPTNLKSRMQKLMSNLKLKKEDEQKDPRPDFPPLDVSDNSPDYDHGGTLLLTKSSSIDKLSPQIRARGAGFFNEEINIGKANKEIEDDEGVKVLNLFPIKFAEPDAK